MSHPSDSAAQQRVEECVRKLLGAMTGLVYVAERVDVGGEYVTIDAVGRNDAGEVVELVEIYARHGLLKGAQHKKPTDDAARLLLAQEQFPSSPQLRLAWCSAEAIGQVQRGWRGRALETMGVELMLVELSEEAARRVREAQTRQFR